MARVGWVSAAEEGTDNWYRLSVFDDGWVDLPGFGRSLSDTRQNLRRSLLTLAVLFGSLGGAALLGQLTGSLDGVAHTISRIAMIVLVVAGFSYCAVVMWRMKTRDHRQSFDDHRQARRLKDQGRQLQRAPGTSWFGRVDSAQAMADALINVRLTRSIDIAAVTVTEHDKQFAAFVEFADGSSRRYATPDRTIIKLLGRFGAKRSA